MGLSWALAVWTAFQLARIDWPHPMTRPVPRAFWTRRFEAPRLVPWLLPYREWDEEYRGYFQRHAHDPRILFRPSMIVMHYTVTDDAQQVWDSFERGCRMDAGDFGLVWGHASVQLMIDKDGTIYQLMPLNRRCTGAYGVNHVALSIEMVATTERDLLSRPRQVWASFCLVRELMRRYDIPLSQVRSHFEVSVGRAVVPEYLDYADSKWPFGYPPHVFRYDPGITYMGWLRTVLGRR